MAGTRLLVHATFVAELAVLVLASLLYASQKELRPSDSAEPFRADRSGWRVLEEDVGAVPSPEDGVVGRVAEICGGIAAQVNLLLGADVERAPDAPPRPSAFVEELRRRVAWTDGSGRGPPPMRVDLVLPQVESSSAENSIANALGWGFGSLPATGGSAPSLLLEKVESQDGSTCDDIWRGMQSGSNNRREAKFPKVTLLLGCNDDATAQGKLSSVDADFSDIVVRTTLTLDGWDGLLRHLEEDVAGPLLKTLLAPPVERGYDISSVYVEMVDEDPSTHAVAGEGQESGLTTGNHFRLLGRALSSSVRSRVGPLLDALELITGGIDVDGTSEGGIRLQVHSSAYLPIPEDFERWESDEDDAIWRRYVSSKDLGNFIHENSHPSGDVQWTLFVASKGGAPLEIRDASGEHGEAITLSPPLERAGAIHPNGASVVNLPDVETGNVGDPEELYQMYQDKISRSLDYLVGYVRATQGLPPSAGGVYPGPSSSVIYAMDGGEGISFGELESIARSRYRPVMDQAFEETDAMMGLLRRHSWTLAFPEEVAQEINTATRLLRQSISQTEEGYPAIYALSSIQASLRCLETARSHHRLMAPPYFAPDHYLAVFSPLVLPLFLPMVLGLVREVKRFRELRRKASS